MKKLLSAKSLMNSHVISEAREREQRLNTFHYGDDIFNEIDKELKNNNFNISINSRYEKLKKEYRCNNNNKKIIAFQEASQFLKIIKYICSDEKWRSDIQMSFTNDPTIPRKNSSHTPGKDKQFELYLAARFKKAQINVIRDEPDIVCNINEYTFTVAAKRIKSRKKVFKRIKEAAKQIIKARKPGIIALDLSPLQTMYYSPYQTIQISDFLQAANNFLDIEFESKLNEIRKRASNNKIIGIIAFSMFVAKHPNNNTNILIESHNGSRLCKPNTEKAMVMWNIVDKLSNDD